MNGSKAGGFSPSLSAHRAVYKIYTVCAHYNKQDTQSASAACYGATARRRQSAQRIVYLTIGWCPGCAAYLEGTVGPGGVAKEPTDSTSLAAAMQLWLWKQQKRETMPVHLDRVPADMLGAQGAQPEEMGDEALRPGRMALYNMMEAIQPSEVALVSHDAWATDGCPALHVETDDLGAGGLYRLAHRAQFWTLAWATGQDYGAAGWRRRNPVPASELRVPRLWHRVGQIAEGGLVSFGTTPPETPSGSPGCFGRGDDGDDDGGGGAHTPPRRGLMEHILSERLGGKRGGDECR